MTYSQPTTGRVNVSGRTGSGPGAPRIDLPSSTPMSPHGTYLDKRNPDRAYQSKIAETEALTGFIKKLVGDQDSGLTKLVTEKIQSDAQKAVGEIINETDINDVPVRDQDRFRQLSPYAKTLYEAEEAKTAVMNYPGALNAATTLRPLLQQDATNNPELQAQQAVAWRQVQAEAAEKSGLSALSPGYRLQYNENIQNTNSIVSGTFRQNRAKDYTNKQKSIASNGLASQLAKFGEGVGQYPDSAQQLEALRGLIQAGTDEYGSIYTSKDLAEIVGNGINRYLPQLLENKATRSLVLANLRQLTNTEVKLRDGQNLWDVANAEGKSLRMILQENIKISSDLSDQRYIGELELKAWTMLEETGNLTDAVGLLRSAGVNLANRKNMAALAAAMGRVQDAANPLQKGNQIKMLDRLRTENREDLSSEVVDGVIDGRYSYQFGAQFLRDAENETVTGSKTQQAISNSLRTVQGASYFQTELQSLKERVAQRHPGFGSDKVVQRQLDSELTGEYVDIVEAEVAADPKYDIAANTQTNLQLAEQRLAEKYAAKLTTDVSSLKGGAKKVKKLLQDWTDVVRTNGGEITAEAFGPEVVVNAKKLYKTDDPNLKQLTETFISLQANAERTDGTKVFADRQAVKKALRKVIKSTQEKSEGGMNALQNRYGLPQSKRLVQDAAMLILDNAGLTPEEDGSNNTEVGTALTEASLRSMSGATNPEAEIQNAENYGALASGMSLDKKLPQVAPEEEASPLSTSFSSQNDTIFIAIGINEGTRRADGTYTKQWSGHKDPGNGAWNRGTVSAQSGSLSPKQTDMQFRGKLAQWAINTQPFLRQMGLQPGTVGYNNVMFNVLDLFIQAPAAVPKFIQTLAAKKDFTIEGIAEARAMSFFDQNGRLDTTFKSYKDLLRDQRSRAGTLQYRRRF